MTKCALCKTGKVTSSGSHDFCDNCGYSAFKVTDDYIHVCSNLLATLCSNTKFVMKEDYEAILERYIYMHLPRLYNWLETIATGRQRALADIAEVVQQSAVNLQIGHDINNPQEAANDLACQCGSDDFAIQTAAMIVCMNCTAVYKYDKDRGIYYPEFLCSCKWASYEEIDSRSGLVACNNCSKAYVHDKEYGIFRQVN